MRTTSLHAKLLIPGLVLAILFSQHISPLCAGLNKPGTERTISVTYVQADLPHVLRSFAGSLGVNVVVGQEVQGKVTADLKDMPALAAFALIVTTHGYSYKALDNTVIVGKAEVLEKIPTNLMSVDPRRVVTEVLRLQFAKPGDLMPILQSLYPHARIDQDLRQNALVVSTDPDTMKRIKTLVFGPPAGKSTH